MIDEKKLTMRARTRRAAQDFVDTPTVIMINRIVDLIEQANQAEKRGFKRGIALAANVAEQYPTSALKNKPLSHKIADAIRAEAAKEKP